jgi:glycosyltransferase involved in cell wall biosynthesis
VKILFLCKRRPLARDLLTRPYGRFYYLPKLLAEKGHEVHVALLSYKKDRAETLTRDGIHWTSVSVLSGNPLRYISNARQLVRTVQPDWIGGLSDTWYGILAQRLGQHHGVNTLIDAYDNYESYIPWLKPLHSAWRKSLSRATLVTAAGPNLADLLGQDRTGKPTITIPMAADPVGFKPMEQSGCRQQLGLPEHSKLVGYCGSVFKNRGVEVLCSAVRQLQQETEGVELVLAGRKDKNITLPPDAIWLENIADDKVPLVFNSLDILTVINKSSAFGNFSYPVKLYEAMNCQLPVIASSTPATRWILNNNDKLLVDPGDAGQLCMALKQQLNTRRIDYGSQPDWHENCDHLEQALKDHG